MRKWLVAAALAAIVLVGSPSTSTAQVVVQSYSTPVYSYSYSYPTYTYGYSYAPVYSYPAYSYTPVYDYPAYGGISIGIGTSRGTVGAGITAAGAGVTAAGAGATAAGVVGVATAATTGAITAVAATGKPSVQTQEREPPGSGRAVSFSLDGLPSFQPDLRVVGDPPALWADVRPPQFQTRLEGVSPAHQEPVRHFRCPGSSPEGQRLGDRRPGHRVQSGSRRGRRIAGG